MNKTDVFHEVLLPRAPQVTPLKIRLLKIFLFFSFLAAAVILYPKFREYREQGNMPAVVTAPAPGQESNFAKAEVFRQTLRYMVKNYYDTDALGPKSLLKESLLGLSRSVPDILILFPEGGGSLSVEVAGKKKSFSLPNMKTAEDILPVLQDVFSFTEVNY